MDKKTHEIHENLNHKITNIHYCFYKKLIIDHLHANENILIAFLIAVTS